MRGIVGQWRTASMHVSDNSVYRSKCRPALGMGNPWRLLATMQDASDARIAVAMPRPRLLQCLQAVLFTVPLLKGIGLPTPTGTHIVGSRSFVWTDRSRTDVLSTSSEPRTLSVRAYYPADSTTGTAGAYLPDWPLWIRQVGE